MQIPEKALIQAPLARYTRYPFRVIAAENGAHFTLSELVNARALFEHFNGNPNTHTQWLAYTDELESNVGIQLFGNDPILFYKAAREVEENTSFKFIDVNLGCPKRKITKTGSGVALLKNLETVSQIIESLVKATSLPITIKTRLGWDSYVLDDLLKIAEDCGVFWVMIHGRYANESYDVPARRDFLSDIIGKYETPIIANGDVFSLHDINDYFDRNVSGIAIGRWARENPLVFANKEHTTPEERINVFNRFIELHLKVEKTIENTKYYLPFVKAYAINTVKGFRNSSQIRNEIQRSTSLEDIVTFFSCRINEIISSE